MGEDTAGRIAYEAFAKFLSKSGDRSAPWPSLPEDLREAWEVAATAVIQFEAST